MLDQLDARAAEKKAAQEASARQEAETTAQPEQEAPQQAQKPAEVKSEAETKAPQKAPQQGAQLKADRDTVKRAYKDFSNTGMKQSRFEALYNEAYNAESFEAFTKKHPNFGEKLKGAMQKAFENGQRARDGANTKALSDNGMIMNEDDAFLLNSRKNVDSLIARYKEEAESGMYWDEADNGDAVQLRLEESEIAARREAIKKLEAYRDENFSQKTEQKTEKQAPKKKPVSTEKKLENTIQTLENYKKHLENGDMAKLEQKNPDRYSEMMYKLEQITADENGSDYFYDTDEVSVLIDKYKEKLELVRAQNGAQAENVGAQSESTRAQAENDSLTKREKYSLSKQEVAEIKKGVSVITDADNNTTIDIKSDVLENIPKKDWLARVKNIIRSVFPEGFSINGEHIEVSAKSRGEFSNSKESKSLSSYEPEVYADKMRTSPYLDTISQSTEYKNEPPEHPRNDNIVSFDRGNVNLKIGENEYSADVLIGVKKDGRKLFYDLSNINKKKTTSSEPELNSRTSEQLEVASTKSIAESNKAVNPANEYSSEYQNGAEHPETVGAMESDKQNITRAINENGALPQKKKPFSDFDRYKADNDIPSGERAALARKINDPMLGEITVAQNIANLAKDGAKFIEQDGKYYAQNKDGNSVRVSKSAYNYGKWLNDNGVFYTLNQNAEVPKKINGKYVSKSVTTFIASRGGTDAVVQTPNFLKIRHFTFWAHLLTQQHIYFVFLYMMCF